MSNKKQSSVEWLYDTIDDEILNLLDGEIDLNELSIAMLKIKEQAKAMHKEEIIDAWNGGDYAYFYSKETGRNFADGKEYYNETFGRQDERDRSIPQ